MTADQQAGREEAQEMDEESGDEDNAANEDWADDKKRVWRTKTRKRFTMKNSNT
jgi:hypothetical protein